MANRALTITSTPIVWGAVIGGVFVALVVHILLNMLGAGLGAATIDFAPAEEAQGLTWTAFIWWSLSGIIAAFAGGWAAGAYAGSADVNQGATHGFLAWAVTTVLVVVATAAGIVLIDPLLPAIAQLQEAATEAAQTDMGAFMLASFVALLIGAVAAIFGGRLAAGRAAAPARSTRRAQRA